jgi:hydroxymethylglutaryl-CoA synthase
MQFGIEAISFYVPNYYLDLATLAAARSINVDKYYIGLGQHKMAMAPPDEDIVTMAANCAESIIKPADKTDIDTLMFATESGVDCSKAAGIYVHKLLDLPSRCRVIELKQACFSATMGIQMAMSMLAQNPKRKILLIASDIARYGFNTAGESSQGVGAVAMLLSANPKVLIIESESGFYTEDVMDFWRPNYCDSALVNGKYSCDLYLRVLEKVWQQYSEISGRKFSDHAYICYHVPVPRLVEKAHRRLVNHAENLDFTDDEAKQSMDYSLRFGREIGNCYSAALYVSLLSLLVTNNKDLANNRIGLYSYGAGCVGEFFSALVVPNYQNILSLTDYNKILAERNNLSYKEYEEFYNFKLPIDGSCITIPKYTSGKFRLRAMDKHKRIYERVI